MSVCFHINLCLAIIYYSTSKILLRPPKTNISVKSWAVQDIYQVGSPDGNNFLSSHEKNAYNLLIYFLKN